MSADPIKSPTPLSEPAVNYMQLGRWMKCSHCGCIVENGMIHYCGAPWQIPPTDVPKEWLPMQPFSPPSDTPSRVSPSATPKWLNPKNLAHDAVQRLADSEPTDDSIEGMERLRGTPQESMFVVNAAELVRVIECTLEDALYDASRSPSSPVPSSETETLKRENERLRADIEKGYSDIYKTQLRYRESAREATERYGFKEGELQMLWRGFDCFKRKYDQGEVIAAICDALTGQGQTAWSGDGTSCVEQMIRLQWERAEKAEAALASLKEQHAEQKQLIEVWDAWAAQNLPDFGIPVSELWRREKQAEAHPETLMSSAQFFDELRAKLRLLSTSDSEQK